MAVWDYLVVVRVSTQRSVHAKLMPKRPRMNGHCVSVLGRFDEYSRVVFQSPKLYSLDPRS